MMIPKPTYKTLWKRQGNTRDIMAGVMESVKDETWIDQTKEYAKHLNARYRDSKQLLERVWLDVRANVSYMEDPPGKQWIKSPSLTWDDAYGDCKSMTVFISSVLSNLGIKHKIRFSAYGLFKKYTHVYPVAILGGREVVVDAVYHFFDSEASYIKKKDYTIDGKSSISGLEFMPYPRIIEIIIK